MVDLQALQLETVLLFWKPANSLFFKIAGAKAPTAPVLNTPLLELNQESVKPNSIYFTEIHDGSIWDSGG